MIRPILILLAFLLGSYVMEAQFVRERAIKAQIGYGATIPNNSIDDIAGNGLFLQGEYVLTIESWLRLKPYLGLIFTNSDGRDLEGNPTTERAETKAVLLGGKFRLSAPMPWIAPYLEAGIGASGGSFETMTAYDTIQRSGLTYHIPFSIGLELGPKHNVDLGFAYYFQPAMEQITGALAFGVTIPMR